MSAPISFGFSKKVQHSKLVDSKLRDESTKDKREETDFVEEVVGNVIKGTLKKEAPKEWIIPLIKQNVWRKDELKAESKEAKDRSSNDIIPPTTNAVPLTAEERLERQAISELLAQANGGEAKEAEIYEIPLLLQNRIPTGYEEDDNMDVSLRPEQSSLDDYENYPVEQFGMAMLRGMGWKKAEGIGRTNKGVVELKEPTLRPKGLGLGAERPQANKDAVPSSTKSLEQSKLTLKIGAFVVINKGSNKGFYGQVESFDEDNNRVILKLAINGKMVAVSKFYIDLISSEEYNQKSKILNLEKYEKYKTSQEENGGVYRQLDEDKSRDRDDERLEDSSRRSDGRRRERERTDEKDYRYETSKRDSSRGDKSKSHHEERHSSRSKKKDKKSKRHRHDSSSRERKSHKKRKHRDD